MPTLVSRNTIKLSSSASTTNDFYKGNMVEFTRLDKRTGKKTVQKMEIIAYDGTNRIATVDGLWEENVIPGPETSDKKDSYKIVPKYPDSRASINPAILALDYITSERYGRGLDPIVNLNLPSWLESGRVCDKKSDVTVQVSTGTLPSAGAVYRYPASGNILWQGTVDSVSGQYVRFTNVIGKLTNKWNSWKTFPANAIIYDEARTYSSDSTGIKTTRPTHTSGSVGGLTFISGTFNIHKVSGTGGATLALPADGNPIRAKKNGITISGYSLYDSDGIDYWRYVGWDGHDQRYVTQHQVNLTVDTSQPLFDNMNSLLEHFGGILRYTAGKYYLEVEQPESGIQATNDPRRITESDILGNIKISDEGTRSAFNSLTVAFPDPANKFEARNISFFNSNFLKIDRNVARKGSLSVPGVTNYYNAKLLADAYLTKSRYNLSISFNMIPKGQLLLAGRVIELPYSRFDWNNKKFRIRTLTHNPDCSVDIVAEEYDESFYTLKPVTKLPAAGIGGSYHITTIGNPTNLIATSDTNNNEGVAGVQLTWDNAPGANAEYVSTEIYMSYSPNFEITVTSISGTTFTTSAAHGLVVGALITSETESNGLIANGKYYVQSVPSSTTFTLAYQKGGSAITFTNGTGSFKFTTATIIAVVPVPENSYTDPYYVGGNQNRVVKYYWIRHRINTDG